MMISAVDYLMAWSLQCASGSLYHTRHTTHTQAHTHTQVYTRQPIMHSKDNSAQLQSQPQHLTHKIQGRC